MLKLFPNFRERRRKLLTCFACTPTAFPQDSNCCNHPTSLCLTELFFLAYSPPHPRQTHAGLLCAPVPGMPGHLWVSVLPPHTTLLALPPRHDSSLGQQLVDLLKECSSHFTTLCRTFSIGMAISASTTTDNGLPAAAYPIQICLTWIKHSLYHILNMLPVPGEEEPVFSKLQAGW